MCELSGYVWGGDGGGGCEKFWIAKIGEPHQESLIRQGLTLEFCFAKTMLYHYQQFIIHVW